VLITCGSRSFSTSPEIAKLRPFTTDSDADRGPRHALRRRDAPKRSSRRGVSRLVQPENEPSGPCHGIGCTGPAPRSGLCLRRRSMGSPSESFYPVSSGCHSQAISVSLAAAHSGAQDRWAVVTVFLRVRAGGLSPPLALSLALKTCIPARVKVPSRPQTSSDGHRTRSDGDRRVRSSRITGRTPDGKSDEQSIEAPQIRGAQSFNGTP
jgi:hypothetical protein